MWILHNSFLFGGAWFQINIYLLRKSLLPRTSQNHIPILEGNHYPNRNLLPLDRSLRYNLLLKYIILWKCSFRLFRISEYHFCKISLNILKLETYRKLKNKETLMQKRNATLLMTYFFQNLLWSTIELIIV